MPASSPASTPTRVTKPTRTPARGDFVSVTRSGGFAGLTDTVTVRADGAWTRSNRRTPERTGRLSEAQLSRLRTLTTDPRLSAEPPGGRSTTCADAFSYVVVTPTQRFRFDDCLGRDRPSLAIATFVLDATKP